MLALAQIAQLRNNEDGEIVYENRGDINDV